MEFRSFENIIGFEASPGEWIGFHTRNMQVARLSPELWAALAHKFGPVETEALGELHLWNSEVDGRARDIDLGQRVQSLLINVAQTCNLKCSYCAAGGDGTFGEPIQHIAIETLRQQIQMFLHLTPNGQEFSITFFGGEPLLNPSAIESLARYARLQVAGRDIRLRFSLITNGTLLTPALAELLASIQCHITISLDGPAEINDISRISASGRGSTARAIAGLQHLLKVRERLGSLCAGSVFGKHHTAVLETYRFLKGFEFDTLKFDFAADADDEATSREYARQLGLTADEAFASGGERELRRIGLFDTYFRTLDGQLRLQNHCSAGKSMLSIDGKGRMTSCQWFVGRTSEKLGEGNQLETHKLAQFAARMIERHGCESCWARHLCGGGCMYINDLKNGSKQKKDPSFCERTQTTIAKAIEHYAQARYESEPGAGRETH